MTDEFESVAGNEQTVRDYLISPHGANLSAAEVEAVMLWRLSARRVGDAMIRRWRLETARARRAAAEREYFNARGGFDTAKEWIEAADHRRAEAEQTAGGSSGPEPEGSGKPANLLHGLFTPAPVRATTHVTMSDTHAPERKCIHMDVPPEVCYLRFAATKVENTDYFGTTTARGEMVILDYDAGGGVVGIELVGSGKPCQEGWRD